MFIIDRRREGTDVPSEDGFMLLEVIMAISIVVVVMTGLTSLFVTVTKTTNQLRARQSAVMVADQILDQIRTLQPTDTWAGRSTSAVNAQFAAAPTTVIPWLKNVVPASDDSGAAVKLPLTQTPPSINKISYSAAVYLGTCAIPTDSSVGTDCRPLVVTCGAQSNCTNIPCPTDRWTNQKMDCWANGTSVSDFVRVVAAISWTDGHCPSSVCTFVTATLLSSDTDPTFLQNTSPPNPPVMNDAANQVSAINDSVSLQLSVQANTGVTPITYSCTGLPLGLNPPDATGLITGTPTGTTSAGLTGTVTVTCTATDAFIRKDSTTFTWQILPDLVPSTPAPQTLIANKSYSLTLTAAGGSGSPYTWTVPNGTLPPGLTFASTSNNGVVGGTPTTPGTYSTTFTVTDGSTKRSRLRTVSFTVVTATIDGATDTVLKPSTKVVQTLTYTCPSANCSYTLSGAPAGIGLATSSTATSNSASISVSSTSGTLYLLGTTPATFPSGTFALQIVPRDVANSFNGTTETATWTATTISGLTATSVKTGKAITSQPVTYTCAVGSCTIALSASPAGAVLSTASAGTQTDAATMTVAAGSGTIYVRGTITGAAGTYNPVLKITDGNNTAASITAAWTVTP